MEDDKTFELMTKMYAEMQEGFKGVKNDISGMKGNISNMKDDISNMKDDINDLKKTVINIEQDHGKKLEALFDGYKQNSEQLTRIEDEVSKHEEVILKRVK